MDASNPSDFEFLPLGELEFRILTTSGNTFALTSTDGPVSLPRGNLSYFLRGQLWVETRDDLDRFEILLAEYAAGRPSPIISVFNRVRNQPIYEAALQGLGLNTELPGVPGGVRMFDQVPCAPPVSHTHTSSLPGLTPSRPAPPPDPVRPAP